MPVPNRTGTWLMQSSSTSLRFRACWMMSALAIVTNLSPAISFAAAIPSSTLPVKVVRGNRSTASLGGSRDRKSTRLNSSHQIISYAVFCLKKKNITQRLRDRGQRPDQDQTRVEDSHPGREYPPPEDDAAVGEGRPRPARLSHDL